MQSTFALSQSSPGTVHVAREYLRTRSCLSLESITTNEVTVEHDHRLTLDEVKNELRIAGLSIDDPETNGFIQSVTKRVS